MTLNDTFNMIWEMSKKDIFLSDKKIPYDEESRGIKNDNS